MSTTLWSSSCVIIITMLFLCVFQGNGQKISSLRPPMGLGAPSHLVNGNHISLNFHKVIDNADQKKTILQSVLQNFVENVQKNLSTSSVLHLMGSSIGIENEKSKVIRLYDLADYFEYSSGMADDYASATENFFEVAKNESNSLLQKLRQVPSAQRYLPTSVKMHLTDYFAEMEHLNVMFSEVIDEALEYIVDTLRSVQSIFIRYADIQREILRTWNLRLDDDCFDEYIDFLQMWSTEIFKCASTKDLTIAYDVYATTETIAKHFMCQLEFRIQRLFNCFIFGGYQFRCKFVRYPDKDFHGLFAKLEELQQYLDIKIKKGRIPLYSSQRNSSEQKSETAHKQCIPDNFPETKMSESLKQCFYSLT